MAICEKISDHIDKSNAIWGEANQLLIVSPQGFL